MTPRRARTRSDNSCPEYPDYPIYRERPFWQDLLVTAVPVVFDHLLGLVRDVVRHRHELKLAEEESVRVVESEGGEESEEGSDED